MLRGLYSVASAMEASSRNHEIVSENLANAATPGYRRQGSIFEPKVPGPTGDAELADRAGAVSPRTFSNFESGPLQQTSNPLDLALVGYGFFVLAGPNGPLYTRNGGFEIGANGILQLRGSGYPVRGQGGSTLSIPGDSAQITIGADGTVSANNIEIGRLDLATFERPEALRRVGATLFEGDAPQPPPVGALRIEQGYREGSNVQPVQEMVSMMIGMRHYEAAERAIRALGDAVSHTTRPSP